MPAIHLVVFGGNYDIYPLIRIAKELDWRLTVVTSTIKANKSLFTIVDKVIDDRSTEEPLIDSFTAIMLMAHDYKTDYKNLKRMIVSNVPYIGLLGPRKRSQKMFDDLETEGITVPEEKRECIFAPAGLDIGAKNPEEIALSIVAEIQSYFSGKKGTSLRLKPGTIHDN